MTTSALLNGFKVCQVALDSKVHKPSTPKLGPMFTQVITTLFTHISIFKNEWLNGKIKKNCPVHGQFNYEDPQSLSADYKSIKKQSVEGFSKKDALLSSIMHQPHYHAIKKMHLSRRWNIGSELSSFYKQTLDMTHQESEEKILGQAKQFHRCRGYLFNKFGIQKRN